VAAGAALALVARVPVISQAPIVPQLSRPVDDQVEDRLEVTRRRDRPSHFGLGAGSRLVDCVAIS